MSAELLVDCPSQHQKEQESDGHTNDNKLSKGQVTTVCHKDSNSMVPTINQSLISFFYQLLEPRDTEILSTTGKEIPGNDW